MVFSRIWQHSRGVVLPLASRRLAGTGHQLGLRGHRAALKAACEVDNGPQGGHCFWRFADNHEVPLPRVKLLPRLADQLVQGSNDRLTVAA